MRRHAWNDVATMTAIDAEISVSREHDGISKRLGHAHEAGLCEAHGHIGVLLQELEHRLKVLCQLKRNEQGTSSKQLVQARRTAHSDKVKSFGQSGFACAPRGREPRCLRRRPIVMGVAIAEQCDDESGVNEDVSCHSQSPASTASCAR